MAARGGRLQPGIGVALVASLVSLGCTEAAKPSPAPAPSGTAAASQQSSAPAGATTIECVEVLEHPDDPGMGTRRKRGVWSVAERIYTELESDAVDARPTLSWLYRDDGQIIAYIGVSAQFQHDYAYDDHGNAIDFVLSYPSQTHVRRRSAASPWIGRRHVNEYDAGGRLAASTVAGYGPGNVSGKTVRHRFVEDAQGRCVSITGDDGSSTTFGYDSAGRLAKTEVRDSRRQETQATTFDASGRPLTWTQTVSSHRGLSSGTISMTYQYLPDGSEVVDVRDGLTDVGSGHEVRRRSAGCLRVDAARGHLLDARCHVGG